MIAKRDRSRVKGRLGSGGYFALPHAVMSQRKFAALSAHGKTLLLDLGWQFRGGNNGDLAATWSIMEARGWRSRSTLGRALSELLQAGLIMKTRQGGRRVCSLYALAWLRIDECDGKLDVAPTKAPPGGWRD